MSALGQAFVFIGNHGHLLLAKSGQMLVFCLEAMIISLLIAVPLGIFLGHLHRFSFLAINVSNIGRALPSLAVLAILLGLGPVLPSGLAHFLTEQRQVVITLVILAVPPILTNTYVAVDQVEPDVVEAAKGMGLRPVQVALGAELPLALPVMFAGIRTAAVFIVASAPLAGLFGGGGLGDIIANEASYHLDGVVGASYVAIALAFAAQGVFLLVERTMTPAGLKAKRASSLRASVADELATATDPIQGRF